MTPCPPWLGAGAEKEVAGPAWIGRRRRLGGGGQFLSARVNPHSFSARVKPDGSNFVAVFICHRHFLFTGRGPEVIVEDMG